MIKRIPVPKDIEAEILFNADHTCSICNNPTNGVQIAHMDGDPSNNKEGNLIAICPSDHGRVDSKSPISKSFKPEELKKYKENWERSVKTKRSSLKEPPSTRRLIRFDGVDVNTVYLETQPPVLRRFQDPLTFELMGFNWGNIDIYPDSSVTEFEIKEPLKKLSEARKIRLKFQNGTLANEVFVVWEDGKKHWVPDAETLNEIGGFENIEDLDYLEFNSIPHGQPLIDIFQVRTKRILQKSISDKLNEN